MYHFCTYFDANFLAKGLTLYRSLVQHGPGRFTFWVLCLDDLTYKTLIKLAPEGVRPISMTEFEAGDHELLKAKSNRNRVEYFFTCTPSLPLFVLRQNPGAELVSYVDADLFFFSSFAPVTKELENGSILIIEHRFAPEHRHLESHGIYNVGLLSFRNNAAGRECLEWWRTRCLEWCYDRIEEGRYADQKYLDDWPKRFPGVVVFRHKGANVAPWNVFQHRVTQHSDGRIKIDGDDLIFYHFHRLNQFGAWLCDPGLAEYRSGAISPEVRNFIYRPYLRALDETRNWIRSTSPETEAFVRTQRYRYRTRLRAVARSLLRGQLIVK